jgi:hypothetical protein
MRMVKSGDDHVSVLGGDRFTNLHRFATSFGLHGGPKFGPDGPDTAGQHNPEA